MVERAGDGRVGVCCLSLNQSKFAVSECAVFLTRASARLMGVCLGAFRGRSCGLFPKTHVSDYDRGGSGAG